jgi:predicted amidophosphoribosyltransferase
MLCSKCNRVFEDKNIEICPVCKDNKLSPANQINCPNCQEPMQIGYLSIPLKMDWRSKYAKGMKPEIIIKDEDMKGGWIRRIAYHCIKKISKKIEEKLSINLLCPVCGREKIPNAKFCPYCGSKFGGDSTKKISRFKVESDIGE